MTNRFGKVVMVLALLGCTACSDASGDNPLVTNTDTYPDFAANVFPILIRDCGFHACHGAPERFFRVYGPGRARIDPTVRAFGKLTGAELPTNYTLALSMIDAKHPENSLLLRKPLAVEAGGTSHGGVDRYGRNVYRTVNDQGYLTLKAWVMATAAAMAAPMTPPAP